MKNEFEKKKNPVISIVVPTKGRYTQVKELLISIQQAIFQSKIKAEIIICDDSDATDSEKIKLLCKRHNALYIYGFRNVGDARNHGIEYSKGEIIFFTDSDCKVTENILNEHLKLYSEPETGGVLGVTQFYGTENLTWRIISRTMFLDSFSFAKVLNKNTSAPWGTCTNISFRKKVLENIGGFDINLPFNLGGEDTELCIRVNQAGYKIKLNPDAVVMHTRETWSNFSSMLERAFRWGRADFHILKKHPHLECVAFPNIFAIFAFFLLFYLINFLLDLKSAQFIIIVWVVFTLLIESIIKYVLGDRTVSILIELIATFLNVVFDLGTVFESLRRGSLSMLYKRIIFSQDLIVLEWKSEVVRSWSINFGLLLTLFIMGVINGR